MHWVDCVSGFCYINLDERHVRRAEIEHTLHHQLHVPQAKIHRIDAEKGGATGCTRSHLKAVQLAMKKKWPYVCICEDDFMLHVSPAEFHRHVNHAWAQLVGQFDVLYLAMTPIQLEKQGPHPRLQRVNRALAMPATIIKQCYFPQMVEIYQRALHQRQPHDLVTQLYQPGSRWYGFFPAIARQRPGYSDIEKRVVDYENLELHGAMLGTTSPLGGRTGWMATLKRWLKLPDRTARPS